MQNSLRFWLWVSRGGIDCPDSLFNSAPWVDSLNTVAQENLAKMVRDKLIQRHLRVRVQEIDGTFHIRADRNRFSSLAVLVTHLSLVLLLVGILLSALFSWREPLILGPGQPAQIQHLNGATLYYKSYTFSLLPGGRSDVYGVKVTIAESGQPDIESGIDVNKPLVYKNARITLLGPGQGGDVRTLSLLAVFDPGILLVFTAGFLMLIGLVVSYCFPYRAIQIRITPGGSVRLAGWPAANEPEFTAFAKDLQHSTPGKAEEANRHVD
jgi:cytochrome c biogenesis protein ResB